MLELKKGDFRNLRGSGIVYASCIGPAECCPPYPAMAFGHDPLSMLEMAYGRPQVSAEEWEKIKAHAKEKMPFPGILGHPLYFESEADILVKDADILHAGRLLAGACGMAILSTVGLYGAHYFTQQHERLRVKPADRTNIVKDIHTNYDCDGLRKRLYDLGGRMLDGLAKKDRMLVEECASGIVGLFDGTPLHGSALELVRMLKGNHPRKIELSGYVIEKIIAIRADDFAKAAEYRDKIASLLRR